MKTIGVLGGLGPQATMDFEARLHAVSQQLIAPHANRGYPPLLVYYYRQTIIYRCCHFKRTRAFWRP